MLVWLDRPLLPSEYPKSGRDLLLVAERAGPEVAAKLAMIAPERQETIVTVLAAQARYGSGLVTVTALSPELGRIRQARVLNRFIAASVPHGCH